MFTRIIHFVFELYALGHKYNIIFIISIVVKTFQNERSSNSIGYDRVKYNNNS